MRAFGLTLVAGLLAGVLARALMRAVALVEGGDTGFDPAVSAGIVSEFVVAAVGGFLAARARRRHVALGAVVLLLLAGPVLLQGGAIGVSEIAEHADAVSRGRLVGIAALATCIFGCLLAAPTAGWRLGARRI